eukprot:758857-Hanusia_phi.AAC.4
MEQQQAWARQLAAAQSVSNSSSLGMNHNSISASSPFAGAGIPSGLLSGISTSISGGLGGGIGLQNVPGLQQQLFQSAGSPASAFMQQQDANDLVGALVPSIL